MIVSNPQKRTRVRRRRKREEEENQVEDGRERRGRDRWSCQSGESLLRLLTCQRVTFSTILRSVVSSLGREGRGALSLYTGEPRWNTAVLLYFSSSSSSLL